jgi:transposase
MRREGIYSSHLSTWRAQRAAGQFGESPRKRGPVPAAADSRDKQIVELERRAVRAEARADRAERLCALQKKVSELFGLELPDPSETKPGESGTKR